MKTSSVCRLLNSTIKKQYKKVFCTGVYLHYLTFIAGVCVKDRLSTSMQIKKKKTQAA